MTTESTTKTYRVRNSERCYRFKPEAFINHGPARVGVYELVTFDENQKPVILFVGAAFDETIQASLEGHATGTRAPAAEELFARHPNLYFDYIERWDAKSKDDAQDIFWWLVQKHRPPYNDLATVRPSGRYAEINVIEED